MDIASEPSQTLPTKSRRKHTRATTRSMRKAFLQAFAQLGNLTAAEKKSGISRRSHLNWLSDPEYVRDFTAAENQAIEVMEQEAWRRGTKGTVKPVFYLGKRCGGIREFSDVLLIFLLKARRPAIYRDNYTAPPRDAGNRLDELIAAKVAGPITQGAPPA